MQRNDSQMASNLAKLDGWRRVASADTKEAWRDRARLAAMFVRQGDVVCDLGAGAQPLKSFLPHGTKYIPVDCVDTLPGTHLADFNSPDFTLPEEDFNVLTALGVLNWLDNAERFLDRLICLAGGKFIIFTYDLWGEKGEFTSLEECMAVFCQYVQNLKPAIVLRRRVFFTGTLGPGQTSYMLNIPATNTYLKYLRPQEYLVLKLLRLKMMPRWIA